VDGVASANVGGRGVASDRLEGAGNRGVGDVGGTQVVHSGGIGPVGEAISEQFNSQGVANTLWAFARMRTKPGELLMGQLELRVQEISGEFNSQAVANTLWAFATMGTKPGERMMGQLELRVEEISGEFNSQARKHAVGVCDNGLEAGGADDGAAGAEGGGDIKAVHVAGLATIELVLSENEDNAWRAYAEEAGATLGSTGREKERARRGAVVLLARGSPASKFMRTWVLNPFYWWICLE